MTELRTIRVRAGQPPGPARKPRPVWDPDPDEPALLLHVHADHQDRLTIATTRDLLLTRSGLLPIGERLFASPLRLAGVRAEARELRPDVLTGLDGMPIRVGERADLGKLVSRRSRRQRWTHLGWNPAWALGRLTAHATAASGGRDGLSVWLHGTGVFRAGAWVKSFDHAALTITTRGPGQPGALYRWNAPVDKTARYYGHQQADFIDLRQLASALSGSDLADPADACALFGLEWPTNAAGPVAALRAEARALSDLYGVLLAALAQAAPGLRPRDVWSFGSIATYLLDRAGVTSPLVKAMNDHRG